MPSLILDRVKTLEKDEATSIRSCSNCLFRAKCSVSELAGNFEFKRDPDYCLWYYTGNEEF